MSQKFKVKSSKWVDGSQRGIVSLLTTIIISILLSIIGISMVVLSVTEQRQSIDSDQSTTAYYAAEAGIEDGILKVKNALKSVIPLPAVALALLQTSTCTNQYDLIAGASGPPAQLGYTCQLIKIRDNKLIDHLQTDQATQVQPGPVGFTQIRITWHDEGSDGVPSGGYVNPGGAGSLGSGSSWNYPAVIELSAMEYSALISPASPTSPNGVKVFTATLVPSSGAAGNAAASIGTNTAQDGNCGNAPYHCQTVISGFDSTKEYIIRIRPRYQATHFKLEFLVGGSPALVADKNATIDVTGKSGNVYRRVVAATPIQFGAASGLDFVLFGDENVCKDFTVSGNIAQPSSFVCPPS